MRIREFSGQDFDPVSRLLGEQWHARHGHTAYWQGADELCEHLSRSDAGFVAIDDEGKLQGIALLAGADGYERNETMRMHWLQQRTRLAAMAKALGIDARADASLLNDEAELVQKAKEQLGEGETGELVLLIIASQARGTGVGRELLRMGLSWLAAQGAEHLCLVTDDACDWQFYEHLGMRKALVGSASSRADCGLYVYVAPIAGLLGE